MIRSVLLGWLLGGQTECTQQKNREKNGQALHNADLQRKRLRCKCSATCNASKNDFFDLWGVRLANSGLEVAPRLIDVREVLFHPKRKIAPVL